MAGPGGGSSGGGFGGGGGHGGGFSGGGGFGGGSFGGNHGGSFGGSNNGGHFGGHHGGHFGGHHHHGPHHHGPYFHGPFFGGGWGWGRRRYRTGGCGTGLIIALFVIFAAIWMFAPNQTVYIGEEPFSEELVDLIEYEESTMQELADTNYKYHFGDYDNYENNILLVFLKNEACDGYYTIAWVGDNIRYEINEMFGEYTEYGDAMRKYINENYYAYSLDTNLASVVKEMYGKIVALGLESSFNSQVADYEKPPSRLDNTTALEMNEELLNGVLADFTEQTGIPCVIVVDSAEKVFGAQEEELTPDEAEPDYITPTAADGEFPDIIIDGEEYTEYPSAVSNQSGISYVFIIAIVLIALVGLGLFLRLKKGNKFTEEEDEGKGKNASVGKGEKPPWEM